MKQRAPITIPPNRKARALVILAELGVVDGAPIEHDLDRLRPKTRGECALGARPCPWVGCAHHLYLDVIPETGALKLNHPDRDFDELEETCSLDVADRGPHRLERVGRYLNVTRERARQLEVRALHLTDFDALRAG